MKTHKVNYSDEPIGSFKIVKDFLPSPAELARADETVKITLSLTKKSLEYFKKAAKQQRAPYQRLIRSLLDHYVMHYRE